MKLSVEKVMKRYGVAVQDTRNWDAVLRDAYEFGLPQRDVLIPGARKGDRVFDSTAPTSAIAFANRVQSDLMPPFHRWAILRAGPAIQKEDRDRVNQALEYVTEQLFAVLHSSMFDTANNEVLLDLAVGTGVMRILEGDPAQGNPVRYNAIPAATCHLDEGPDGTVDGVFREFDNVAWRNVLGEWPDAMLTDEMRRKMGDQPDATAKFIECSYADRDTPRWHYEVIEQASKERIVNRQYYTRPWVVPRWIKVAGETRGRGPLVQALGDIKTLNKLVELVLKNAALHVSGLWTGVSGTTFNPNNVRIVPGGVIPVDSNLGGARGPSLQALERPGSFDIAFLEREKLETNIRRYLLDERLPPMEGGVRSATEIIERIRQLAKDVGAPFGRLYSEYIVPIIRRTLDILHRQGLVPDIKIDGLWVKVAVVSPLAREQDLADIESVIRWAQLVNEIGGPEIALLGMAIERLPKWFAEKFGVPSELVRTEDETKQIETVAGKLIQERMTAQQQVQPGAMPENVVPLREAA